MQNSFMRPPAPLSSRLPRLVPHFDPFHLEPTGAPFFFLFALIEPPLDFDDTFGHSFDDPAATALSLSTRATMNFQAH